MDSTFIFDLWNSPLRNERLSPGFDLEAWKEKELDKRAEALLERINKKLGMENGRTA